MQKAIIVGATSGIGLGIARILIKEGYKVGVTGRRQHRLEEFRQENPDQIVTRNFDCTSEDNAGHLDYLVDRLQGIDLLVLSSGIGYLNKHLQLEKESKTIALNVKAFTEIVNWAMHRFQSQNKGQLVVISSIAGLRGGWIAPAYGASKSYQIRYLEGLRQRCKKLNLPIVITDIRPGFVKTEMAKGDGRFWQASVEKAAKQCVNVIRHKKDVGYVTRRWRLIAYLLMVLPNWLYKRIA